MNPLASLIAAAAIASASFVATPAVAEPAPLVALTLNVHGGVPDKGGNGGNPTAVKRDVLALVTEHHPDVIGLQELCHRQARALAPAMKKLGYRWKFTTVLRTTGCNDQGRGNKWGLMIFTKGSHSGTTTTVLPYGKNAAGSAGWSEPRVLLCVNYRGAKSCVTHLSTRDPDRGAQLAKIAAMTATTARLVLVCDCNALPTAIRKTFPERFEAAVPSKAIDHVVASSPVSLVAYSAVPSSDHPAVVAKVKG